MGSDWISRCTICGSHWRSAHVINYHGFVRWVGIMTCPLIAWAPDTSAKSVSVRLPLV